MFVTSSRGEMNGTWLWNQSQKRTILSAGLHMDRQYNDIAALQNLMGNTISKVVKFRAAEPGEQDAAKISSSIS
jgi:hypothetical protein